MPYTTSTTATYTITNGEIIPIKGFNYKITKDATKLVLDADLVADGKRITFDRIEI